ncbi:MAG: endonuclease, partial [Bacteroidales bacterium]|nr:endonuclease [Bacteroidales bacterium]
FQVWFPFLEGYSTREVLYVKGNLAGKGEVHVFVNHWPSRSGGEIESRPKRVFVAELVRSKVDSIFKTDSDARIIITGDFNDEPNDLSIVSGLNGLQTYDNPVPENLYALSMYLKKNSSIGSYKYKGNWNLLDQFIVSSSLLDTTQTLYCRPTDLDIIQRYYLFEEDKTYMGKKPFRTYLGNYYHGGYSDHLPVEIKLRYRD